MCQRPGLTRIKGSLLPFLHEQHIVLEGIPQCVSTPGLASLEGCREEGRQDLQSVMRFRLPSWRVGDGAVLSGGPRSWFLSVCDWDTQEAAGLSHPHSHLMHPLSGKSASFMVSKPKAWHRSKTKRPEVPVHVQLSLQMRTAPISVTLLFCWACWPCWRCCGFCGHTHTVVIMFDIIILIPFCLCSWLFKMRLDRVILIISKTVR